MLRNGLKVVVGGSVGMLRNCLELVVGETGVGDVVKRDYWTIVRAMDYVAVVDAAAVVAAAGVDVVVDGVAVARWAMIVCALLRCNVVDSRCMEW